MPVHIHTYMYFHVYLSLIIDNKYKKLQYKLRVTDAFPITWACSNISLIDGSFPKPLKKIVHFIYSLIVIFQLIAHTL
jgi:hypothetical protein